MKIFSELIIDSYRNTVLVLSFIWFLHLPYVLLLFCIMFLGKLGWTGHPQPSLQEVACGRAPYLPFQQDSWISATRISATCHVGGNTSTQIGLNLERYPCWLTIAAKTSTSKSSKSKRLPVKTLLLKGVPLEASVRAKTCIKILCVLWCIYIYVNIHITFMYISKYYRVHII